MTAPENFVARWSRLKRGSATDSDSAPAENIPSLEAPACGSFDPASLPPLESITSVTDIRVFLQSGVPAELARAALRRAWASDPAIRDFIGIAENQWDFTDPTAIPGFGPMRATDDVAGLVAQALGTLSKVPEAVAAEEAPAALDHRSRQQPAVLAATPAPERSTPEVTERADPERPWSPHGSALPR